jgi:type IV pilus assembly protein PilN
MARINLLPWREELRARRKKEFFAVIGIAAVVTLVLWGVVHLYYSSSIDNQGNRNKYLEAEITKLDAKIEEIKTLEKEREQLLARMKAIEKLQTSRPLIVHLFDEIVNTLPEGVYLTSITQTGKEIVVNGAARSNARVSNFMRNIEKSDFLENARLDVVQTGASSGKGMGKSSKDFALRFSQTLPKAEEEAEQKTSKKKPAAKTPVAKPAAPPAPKESAKK